MNQPKLSNSSTNALHHEVFDEFQPYSGPVKADFNVDWLGTVTHKSAIVWDFPSHDRNEQTDLPVKDEEYFEWIDILQSVTEAAHSYTIVELGAGYGRWAACGIMAARSLDIKNCKAVLVEAEPKHIEWAHQHMANNHISPAEYKLQEVAVGGKYDKILFWVSYPHENGIHTPQDWYGQSIVQNDIQKFARATDRNYMGKKIMDLSSGAAAIEVDMVPLSNVLADLSFVDLIDMDVQGAEADVIENGIDVLNQKVRRVHIGTHNHEVEDRIRKVMTKHGWANIWDFACHGERDTPFGRIVFQDGVQSWLNPRLPSQSNKPIEPPAGIKLF